MRTPARPRHGAAGAEIEGKSVTNRSSSTGVTARQKRTIDVEPNWRRLGTIIDDIIADLAPELTR